MTGRARRISASAAVLAAALVSTAVLAPTGVAGSRDSGQAAFPTLYVNYNLNCTFSIVDDSHKPVSSIPPGTYQVEVTTPIMFKLVVPGGPSVDQIAPNDFTGCKGWVQFQLTGPGVNLFTTLDSGCDAFYTLPATSFKASSTYTAQDLNQPAATRTAFTTLATGTPQAPTSPYGATSGKGETQQQLAGSGNVPFRGTLKAALSASGKPTLTTSKGKAVQTLKAGQYIFAITDQDAKGSFTLQRIKQGSGFKPNELTGVRFVGKNSRMLTLKAGKWMYSAGGAKPASFIVVA
jgi:hypothetical protein